MRRFVDPIPAGGAPVFTEQLNDILSSELWYAIQRVALDAGGNNGPQIMTGGTVTGADMSAGMVMLGETLYRFPATVGNVWPVYIAALPDTIEQKTYADAVVRDLILVQTAEVTAVLPAGNFVTITGVASTDEYRYMRNYIARATALDAVESAYLAADVVLQNNITAEANSRSSADGTLQTNIDNEEAARIAADGVLQGNIDNKVGIWPGATVTIDLADTGIVGIFQSRLDSQGIVHYAGSVKNSSGLTYTNNLSIGQVEPSTQGNGFYALAGYQINTGGDINTGTSLHKSHLYVNAGDTRLQIKDIGDQFVLSWQGSYPAVAAFN